MHNPIRLVIADDNGLVRSTLRKVLSLNDGVEIVGEASDNDQAIECCRQVVPDILLLDMRMRGTPTSETIHSLRFTVPHLRVLILSADDSPMNLSELLSAGIAGYVVKDDATDELSAAITTVA